MVTTVGTSAQFPKLLENFLMLEHDAVAAYDAVLERLDSADYKAKIAEFKKDHERHMSELREMALRHDATIPHEGDMKQMLTTGKVKFADMVGDDGAILAAMSSNETDTVSAYENGMKNEAVPAEERAVFSRAYEDELRHKEWMDRASRES
jgi:rubrerythrin